MRCLLVNPPRIATGNVLPGIGLAYLATALRRGGHTVAIIDSSNERLAVPLMSPARLARALGKLLLFFFGSRRLPATGLRPAGGSTHV